MLELGSGRSTVWFARRAGRVISFEDNEYWLPRTRERLDEAGLPNVDLRLRAVEDFPGEVAALTDDSFDLVVVDFLEAPSVTRIDALSPAMKKVRPGGHLLLDDSDRPGYRQAFELLSGLALPAVHRREGRVARGLRDRHLQTPGSTFLIRGDSVTPDKEGPAWCGE